MGLIALKSKPLEKDFFFQPFISIIVPTYNEETVINKRIKNLAALDYPKEKYEIIIVDSGSKDRTLEIINYTIKDIKCNNVKVIKEIKRNGKGSAINLGKSYANGEIVLVTDANAIFDINVLKQIGPHFKNEKVGAVCGQYRVKNPNNGITNSTQFYWDIEYIERMGESFIDSSCTFHGEINAWRKGLVEVDTKIITEDLDMAVQIRKKGYKIIYEPKAIVYEPVPITSIDQIRQRKKNCIGTIQVILKHWKFFMMPYNLYTLLLFPSHKTIVMLSPFIIIILSILFITNINFAIIIVACMLISFISLFVILLYLRRQLISSDTTYKINISLKSLINILYYVVLNEYLILVSWKDFIFGKYSVLWEKAITTR